MKEFVFLTTTLLLTFASSAQTDHSLFTMDTIEVKEAPDFFGEYRTFCDEISSMNKVENMDGKPTMISIGKEKSIALVIWEGDAKKFEKPLPELFKVGDRVCVIGQITKYGSEPRLEIGTPRQIHKVQ